MEGCNPAMVAHAEPGGVFDREPGLQDAGELDDAEEYEEQDRQDQGELDQALTRAARIPALGPVRGSGGGCH